MSTSSLRITPEEGQAPSDRSTRARTIVPLSKKNWRSGSKQRVATSRAARLLQRYISTRHRAQKRTASEVPLSHGVHRNERCSLFRSEFSWLGFLDWRKGPARAGTFITRATRPRPPPVGDITAQPISADKSSNPDRGDHPV